MELKTQGLDRLMEALSPIFAAELDRVAQETRETLEQDFQNRLQAAVQDAESAAKAEAAAELQRVTDNAAAELQRTSGEADAQLKRAVADAAAEAAAGSAASIRKEVTEELEQQFQQRLAEATNQLNASAAQERARLEEQISQWQTFAEAQRQFAEASSQAEMLSRFLRMSQPFAGGLAVYVAKADGLALWKSRGETAFPEIISKETTDPDSYFRTILMRGKIIGGICARPPFKLEGLEFLCASLERGIEIFGMKLQSPVPKLGLAEAANGGTNSDDQKANAEARRTS